MSRLMTKSGPTTPNMYSTVSELNPVFLRLLPASQTRDHLQYT